MEDWEQFFVEKSRRRADKERLERRRRKRNRQLSAATIALVLIGSMAALLISR